MEGSVARGPKELEFSKPCLMCYEHTHWSDGVCSHCTTKMNNVMPAYVPDHIPREQERRYMKFRVEQYKRKVQNEKQIQDSEN